MAQEFVFLLISVAPPSLYFDLRLTVLTDHEQGWARPCRVTTPATAIALVPHDHINSLLNHNPGHRYAALISFMVNLLQ